MDAGALVKIEKALKESKIEVWVNDLNRGGDFNPAQVDVVLDIKKGDDLFSIPFQVSNTTDIGEYSSVLSANVESGAIDAIRSFLDAAGVSHEEVEGWDLGDIGNWLKIRFDIQKKYDEYVAQFGEFVPNGRGIDARSVEFVPKGENDE